MRKRVQLFIHRWYDAIKLVMLMLIFGLVLLGIVANSNANADSSRERAKAVLNLVELIKTENEKQTVTINRQFQALCFLLVETAGTDALKQLDPPLEQQCLELADELRATERERKAEVVRQDVADEKQANEEASRPRSTPTPAQVSPPSPPAPTAPNPNPLLDLPVVGELLEGLGL